MKKIIILIILSLFLLVLVITPSEAAWFNQDIQWMYKLNLIEFSIFSIGLLAGYWLQPSHNKKELK